MAYNHNLFKTAAKPYKPKASGKKLNKSVTYNVHDTDRYLTDDYAINLALQENPDKFSIGIYITNYKVGISGYQEYWTFKPDERAAAIKTYDELEKRVKKVCKEFEYQNWPGVLIKPVIRNALGDLQVGNKEKSGVYHYNWHTLDPNKEPDWRVTLYGGRYPSHDIRQMDENWTVNSDEVSKQIEVDGRETRDRINRYRYATETKLAQFNRMIEMIQRTWPHLSTAAIISFLTIFGAKGGTPDALAQQIQENPAVVREQIPEVEPDFAFQQEQPQPELEQTPPPEQVDNFSNALGVTLEFEGGYVNHPSDPGGETNKGVTRSVYEQWLRSKGLPSRNMDMRNIPDAHVQAVYRDRYWNKVRGDDLPAEIAQQMFDLAVHSGPSRAIKILQNIVGTKPDGGFGPNTSKSTQAYLQEHGALIMAEEILKQRKAFLVKLLEQEKYQPFRNGWINRIEKLEQMIEPSTKPMVMDEPRMRSKNTPEKFTQTFRTPQSDLWQNKS